LTKPRLKFTVVIEQDERGWFAASVPESPGYHVEAEDLDELNCRLTDLIQLLLEIDDKAKYVWTDASLGFISFG
jgi:predicted RNase H-like HicB family nuclease